MEYTRDLGYCAAKYLVAGGNAAMISMQGGHFVPIPFSEMIDGQTGRTKVRLVDISSTRYAIARRYMIRLRRDDLEDPHEVARLAKPRTSQRAGIPRASSSTSWRTNRHRSPSTNTANGWPRQRGKGDSRGKMREGGDDMRRLNGLSASSVLLSVTLSAAGVPPVRTRAAHDGSHAHGVCDGSRQGRRPRHRPRAPPTSSSRRAARTARSSKPA